MVVIQPIRFDFRMKAVMRTTIGDKFTRVEVVKLRKSPFAILPLLIWGVGLTAPVEVSNPVAPFLRRLEEKGIVKPGFWSTLPRDEAEVASILKEAKTHESELAFWDRSRLKRFLAEFDPEQIQKGTKLYYGDSTFSIRGQMEYFTGGYYHDSLPKAEQYAFGSFTPGIHASYGKELDLISSATVGMERSYSPRFVENYDPQRGLSYNTNREGKTGVPQSVSTFDGYRTVLGYGTTRVRIEAGQDWNQWGPGNWQHATLGAHPFFWVSDSLQGNNINGFKGNDTLVAGRYRRGYRYPGEGPPLPQIRLRVGFGPWEYTKVVAQRTGLWKDSSAYLIAHRLQVRFGNWSVGASEMMAVGTHSPELAALLPAVPLKFSEHAGGDRDNLAMSLDAEWLWGHGRLYGELYSDDFSGFPLNYWGNKLAYTLGGTWQDPFKLPAELHLEFSRTDPWIFQHNLHNTAMQSHGALLGSILPPNARTLFTSVAFPLFCGAQGQVEWHWQQRDLKSPGSSIFDIHDSTSGDTKAFLARDVETRNEVLLSAEWAWRRFVELKAGAGGLSVKNWKGQTSQTLATPEVFGEVYFRY